MKFARQNYTGLQSHFNKIFYSVCQSVSHSISTHMFEYFVRPHICLSVSLDKHCVDGGFYFKWGFGREGPGFESGSSFWGWGTCIFKIEFFGGWVGCFYFELLGDYFSLRGLFLLSFFFCFVVEVY